MVDQEKFMKASPGQASGAQEARRGLDKSEFIPYFQPLVTLRTGELAGYEVLARWEHPTEGLIPPSRFIGIAESDGWIGALMGQVLEKAFAAGTSLAESLSLAINISPHQLHDSSLPKQIEGMARRAGFPLSRLVVEITESALIDDMQNAVLVVAELKGLGCKLALDDFGTGYSSLHHLQSLPFDELKVDRSFVSSMIEKRDSRKIVSAVVGLGQSLGLVSVAEGIETQEQAEMMLWLGCELGQGYFYARPMPASELQASMSAPPQRIVSRNVSAWKTFSAANLDVSPSQRLAQLQAIYDGAPVGLAFVDQSLRYLNLNKKLADMNGAPVEDHLGNKLSEMIPDLFPHVEPFLRRALKGEPVTDVEAKLPKTGRTRLLSYQPAHDEAGEVVGVSISVTDITERKRVEEALARSEAYYRNMVDLNPQVLWIMDPQGRNLDVSPRWDKKTGKMKEQSAVQWLDSVHPEDLQSTVRSIAASRDTGSPIDVRYRVLNGNQAPQWKRSRGAPRFDAAGNIVCWYGSVEDISAPGRLREHDDSGEAEDAQAFEAAEEFTPDYRANQEYRVKALRELDILDTPPEAEFDDLVALAAEICAVPICLISLLDSERNWFKAAVGLSVSETLISTSFCVHAIEQDGLFVVEDALTDERFSQNPAVIGDLNVRFYAGVPLRAGTGVAVGTLCVIDTIPRSLTPGQAKGLAILGNQVQVRMELRLERRKLLKSIESNGRLAEKLEETIKRLATANSQLEMLAMTDALTGLMNRRAFEAKIQMEFAVAQRRNRPLSMFAIDVNDFKTLNDRHGHRAGDEALRHVAEVLRKALRSGDSAARVGGDEFAVILPETTVHEAEMLTQRIKEMLGTGYAGFPRLTLSVGIAGVGSTTTDWEALVFRADLAMYRIKQADGYGARPCGGRNVA